LTAVGALLLVGGSAGAGWSLRAALTRRRPFALFAALLAPLFVLAALVGGVTLLVPGFLR
jgi:Ni/Fe-hydrogenase subunit HybB-like protein